MATLWLTPSAVLEATLRSLIERFARELGTASFAPHVTLAGGWPDSNLERLLASLSGLTPIIVPVSGVSASTAFFRCVAVELEPTAELLAIRNAALGAIGASGHDAYRPHLSLVYGELPAAERERVRAEAERQMPQAIELDRLDVVRTEGAVESWLALATSNLARRL